MNNKKVRIGIDGLSAAGKSSVSSKIAEKLGLFHLETGLFYRLATRIYLDYSYDFNVQTDVNLFFEKLDIISNCELNAFSLYFDGVEYFKTDIWSDSEIIVKVSDISRCIPLRKSVHKKVLSIVDVTDNIIIEGREVGRYLKNLDHRFFFVAPLSVRIERRARQLGVDIDKVRDSIMTRDEKDTLFLNDSSAVHRDTIVFENIYNGLDKSVNALLHYIKYGTY